MVGEGLWQTNDSATVSFVVEGNFENEEQIRRNCLCVDDDNNTDSSCCIN